MGKIPLPGSSPMLDYYGYSLLHNLINWEMTNADILDDEDKGDSTHTTTSGENITYIEVSNEWTQWRDALAESMLNEW